VDIWTVLSPSRSSAQSTVRTAGSVPEISPPKPRSSKRLFYHHCPVHGGQGCYEVRELEDSLVEFGDPLVVGPLVLLPANRPRVRCRPALAVDLGHTVHYAHDRGAEASAGLPAREGVLEGYVAVLAGEVLRELGGYKDYRASVSGVPQDRDHAPYGVLPDQAGQVIAQRRPGLFRSTAGLLMQLHELRPDRGEASGSHLDANTSMEEAESLPPSRLATASSPR